MGGIPGFNSKILNRDFKIDKEAYVGPGKIFNSQFLNNLKFPDESIIKTIEILEKKN